MFGWPVSFSQPAFHTSERRGLGVHHHVGDHRLHELEGGDRAAELLALLGVGHGRVHAALADAHAAGGHAEAPGVERGHRHLEALAHLAEQRVVAHLDAVQRELGGVGGVQPELAVDLRRGEARRSRWARGTRPARGGPSRGPSGRRSARRPRRCPARSTASGPLIRQPPSIFSARVLRLAASEPVSGSVSPKQPSASPEQMPGDERLLLLLGAPTARSPSPPATCSPTRPCAPRSRRGRSPRRSGRRCGSRSRGRRTPRAGSGR